MVRPEYGIDSAEVIKFKNNLDTTRKGLKTSSSGFRPFLSSLFKHKLIVIEFGVEAIEFKELAVIALLDDFSVFEDDDFIRKSGSISLV
ncbi:TPA: hypothetical protein U1B91_000740 [Streptococcus suis]|nr:hypothetical protein [Streptococcus suis]